MVLTQLEAAARILESTRTSLLGSWTQSFLDQSNLSQWL